MRAEAASSALQLQTMEAKREVARVVTLRAVEATPESFAPFGQVIAASPDGDQFGPHDAQLDLSRGVPRSGYDDPFSVPHHKPVPTNHAVLLFSWTRPKILILFPSALVGSTS